jgi:hypothetical protein
MENYNTSSNANHSSEQLQDFTKKHSDAISSV